MTHAQQHSSTRIIATAAAAALAAIGSLAPPAISFAPPIYTVAPDLALRSSVFEHDDILGTSMELIVCASSLSDAAWCEGQVLAEIERLRRILGTYDPASEISLCRAGATIRSPELHELLAAYEGWNRRSDGAINVNMAAVIDLWKSAARNGRIPARSDLRAAADRPLAWNVDALGKGYIIDRAVGVAQDLAPAGLLNIGGDIGVWGDRDWLVGIADPLNPADNAPPLTTFLLRDAAVATSGGYARYHTIAGQRFSHIIDPRSLFPVSDIASATAVAADCLTANALATASCILDPAQASRIAQPLAGGQFMVSSTGDVSGAGLLGTAQPVPLAAPAQPAAWPDDFQVTVNLALKAPAGGRGIKRPYVAVWIEDKAGRVVRTLAVWGSEPKWVRELSMWYRASGANQALVRSVTRATRAAGRYSLTWDGRDDAGKPLPPGDYKVVLEINREHGSHVSASTMLSCGDDARRSASIRATPESEESTVEYGPRNK